MTDDTPFESDKMNIHVISLKRTPERLESFKNNNPALTDWQVFDAIDGHQLNLDSLVSEGITTSQVTYTPGAYGCALSHFALWEKSISLNLPLTICEDDVQLHQQFPKLSALFFKQLTQPWDLILWGWNFDSVLEAALLPGLTPTAMIFNQNVMRKNAATYLKNPIRPSLYKLIKAFGMPCYTISPQGAKKFLAHCRPIRAMEVRFPILNRTIPNFGLDLMTSACYSQTNSLVCFPPLALTPNDHAISTIQRRNDNR